MSQLVAIVVALIVVGLLLWAVGMLPIDEKVMRIIRVVVIVALVLWLLQVFGLFGSIDRVRVR